MPRTDLYRVLGVYAQTGPYDADSDANRGLGMWSYELYGGTTVYFDEAKTWSLAAFGTFETHSSKEGSKAKVGNIFTLEGGLGKSFMDGALSVGVANLGLGAFL